MILHLHVIINPHLTGNAIQVGRCSEWHALSPEAAKVPVAGV